MAIAREQESRLKEGFPELMLRVNAGRCGVRSGPSQCDVEVPPRSRMCSRNDYTMNEMNVCGQMELSCACKDVMPGN